MLEAHKPKTSRQTLRHSNTRPNDWDISMYNDARHEVSRVCHQEALGAGRFSP